MDMAEEENEAGNAAEGTGKKKKLIIIVAILVVVIIIGVVAVMLMGGKKENPDVAKDSVALEEHQEEVSDTPINEPEKIEVEFYDFGEMIVNLNTGGKGTSFLKLKVTFEVQGQDNLEAVSKYKPKINDIFQLYLRELRPSDLQGSIGLYRLREELLLRVNKVIYPEYINDLLFKDILVQ